jgi:hypothetical protein
VIKDPDWRKMKTDVVFYAQKDNSPVRVLCQLSVQKKNSTLKVNQSLQEMLKIKPLEQIMDYRIFLDPKSSIKMSNICKTNYNVNNCFFWDRDNFVSILVDFCDPSKRQDSLGTWMDIAKDHNDFKSVENIGSFLHGSSRKRKRLFESMDEFYEALNQFEDWDDEDTEEVKKVFKQQRIQLTQLSILTDAKLEKMGLAELGLREVVLSVTERI